MPTVAEKEPGMNFPWSNCTNRDVFPTPLSPTRMVCRKTESRFNKNYIGIRINPRNHFMFLSCESAPASQRTALPPSSTNTIIFFEKKALQCDVLTGWLTAGGDNLQDNGMIWRRQSEASNLVIRAISQYFLFDRPVFHLLTHLEESYWSAHRLRAHSAPQLWQIQEMRHRHAEYHLKRGSLTFLVLVLKMEPECLLCCVWPDH